MDTLPRREPEKSHCSCEELTTADIPGAELPRALENYKKTELQFWLKCRGLVYKSTDTKAVLVNRVRQAKDSGQMYKIIDPDPGQCYTRAKRSTCTKCSAAPDHNGVSDSYAQPPVAGWSKSVSAVPSGFCYMSIMDHVKHSGKKQTSDYVEKPLEKGYKFFFENYVHNAEAVIKENVCYVRAKCFRSQLKRDTPHSVMLGLACDTARVTVARCSCKAGASGYCNHIIGLMYLVDHCIKMKLTEFPEIGTCTDNPQKWHRPRTLGLRSEPIMGYNVIKPQYSSMPNKGVQCKIFNMKETSDKVVDHDYGKDLMENLCNLAPDMGFCKIFNPAATAMIQSKLGFKVPQGSLLSYQLSLFEGDFSVVSDIQNKVADSSDQYETFPNLPLNSRSLNTCIYPLSETDTVYMRDRCVTDTESVNIEIKTRGQSKNTLWYEERKLRLTCSTFGLVMKRRESTNNQETFVKNCLIGTGRDLSGVPAIKYGLQNESVATDKYKEYLANVGNHVDVSPSGLIVNPMFPWLAGSPDGKVLDPKVGPGILEVKCSYTHRDISPEDACRDSTFFCEMFEGKPRLKRNHNYYFQVQGQMGVCGVDWCDFVVYTEKGLLIERIIFDEELWQVMLAKLSKFYVNHYIPATLKV